MPTWNRIARDHQQLMNHVREFCAGYGVLPRDITYAGTGDGVLEELSAPPPCTTQTWTLTCTTGGGFGVGQFSVVGSVSGAVGTANVGEFFSTAEIEFVIVGGATDFVVSDQFTFDATQSSQETLGQEWTINRWEPPFAEYDTLSTCDFPERSFDDDTSYSFKLGTNNTIWAVRLAGAVEIDNYSIVSRQDVFDATEAPADWTLEYSDDGVNWQVADTQTNQTWTSPSEVKNYVIAPAVGRHVYWRVNFTDNNGGSDIEWRQIQLWQAGSTFNIGEEQSLLMEGPGLSGTDNIFVALHNVEDKLTPYFNWAMFGAVAFDDNERFTDQPGQNDDAPRAVLNDAPMEYWMMGNGRYVCWNVKISTDYLGGYMGLLLPYSQPAEYSYPLVILGNSGKTSTHYTNTSNDLRSFCDNAESGAGYIREPGGQWFQIRNWQTSFQDTTANGVCKIWPWGRFSNSSFVDTKSEAIDGTYELTPAMVIGGSGYNATTQFAASYGELQDIYHVSGSNNAAENIITVGADSYIVFQNIFRTTFRDFYAVRLVP